MKSPCGTSRPKDDYVDGVLAGRIDYRRFEAVSPIEVRRDGGLAVLRYRSAIDIAVQGQPPGPLSAWHLDVYRRSADQRGQALWSQATPISV